MGATFMAPSVPSDATLMFELRASTQHGGEFPEALKLVEIQVLGPGGDNAPPIADAGRASIAYAGDSVTLDGSGSRAPEGSALRFRWEQVEGLSIVLDRSSEIASRFTAPAIRSEERLVFRLTVSDEAGLTNETEVTVTLVP